jgi:hypothetical protein
MHQLSGRLGHSRHARTLRGWLPLFLCAWCGLSTSFVAGQAGGVEWDVPDTLTADDRRDILEIARRTGIDDPHRIIASPGSCVTVWFLARPVVEGRRVTSARGGARQVQGNGCPVRSGNGPEVVAGNWRTGLLAAVPVESWRIQDGSWFVDVALGRGVDSETAERIVRAARLGQFVERCRQNRSLRHGPSDISSIALSNSAAGRGRGEYHITTSRRGVGILVEVRVTSTKVDALECWTWEA